jgi:toxin YoeB
MEIVYQLKAQDDLKYWKRSGQKQIQQRITTLILAILENPYEGIGKPKF